MSDNIIQLNENLIKTELKSLVKQSVEDTLNSQLIFPWMRFMNLRKNVDSTF